MSKATLELTNQYYDSYMFGGKPLPFDKIGFFNIGYWKGVDNSVEAAQINLIETLIGFFADKSGNVLDVACGKGASTKYLTKYFDPGKITGINISERQLTIGRMIAPECTFKLMDATHLDCEDSTIDNIMCIEAAFHFDTRQTFFEEAARVLKVGGRIAMSDILISDSFSDKYPCHLKVNCWPSLDEYKKKLLQAGFRYVRVEDTTALSIRSLLAYWIKTAEKKATDGRNNDAYEELMEMSKPFKDVACNVFAIK